MLLYLLIYQNTQQKLILGTLRILEAIVQLNKKIKFYQAGSSEMFGKVIETLRLKNTFYHGIMVLQVYSHRAQLIINHNFLLVMEFCLITKVH